MEKESSTVAGANICSQHQAAWALRFDDIIADALELGALRKEEYVLPTEKTDALRNFDLNGVPFEVMCDVIAYYEANRQCDSEWVVLPIANFDCYYGNTNFSKKWLSIILGAVLMREVGNGVSRVKLNILYYELLVDIVMKYQYQ